MFDTRNMNAARIDRKSVSQRGQQNRLVGGVPAIDVECGVGLGITERLGLGEGGIEGQGGIGHAAEDVVRGAVDDAGKGQDAVANEGFLDRLDDWDAPGNGGFEMDGSIMLPGKGEEFDAALGKKGLVAGDDRFFCL